MSSTKPVRFLSAWFCPFAHRAHIALEHTRTRYEWVEALGWFERDGVWHHWKSPELKASNPLGTVPTLRLENEGGSKGVGTVHESLVCVEFLDELAQQRAQPPPPLVPPDPFARASCRLATQMVNQRLCSPYYEVLVKRDHAARRTAFDGLVDALGVFSNRLRETPGPLFLGHEPSLVDVALLPHAFRYFVLEHYRGQDFAVPRTSELAPFHDWLAAMVELPGVRVTLPDKDRYIEHVRKYADDTARSKVANAVRAGKPAHDMS